MKRSNKAVLAYILFYAISYIPHYFGWGTYSQYTLHQIAVEIALVTIMILLFFILREIEEFKEDDNE